MGVYIRDLHLPAEECEPTKLELYADGTVLCVKEADDIYEFEAIEISCHGRLIDADKYVFSGDLLDEPTIIEAE